MRQRLGIFESFELTGLWFLPDSPEIKSLGFLKYTPEDGIKLKLENKILKTESSILHGEVAGKRITLFNWFATSYNHLASPLSYSPMLITANQLIIGEHFLSIDEIIFEQIKIELTNINPWIGVSGLNGINQFPENNSFSFSYSKPEPIILCENEEVEVRITTITSTEVYPIESQYIRINEKNYIQIENKSRASGFFFITHLDSITKFISFATRTAIEANIVTAIASGPAHRDLYFVTQMSTLNLAYKANKLSSENMLFNLGQYKNRIDDIYRKWHGLYINAPEPIGLYFLKRNTPWEKLLTTALALEGAHRKLFSKSKNITLISRIKELIAENKEIMSQTGDTDKLAELIKDHRNYFSHWFEDKKDHIFSGIELYYLSRDANLLLELSFLTALGFSLEERKEMIYNCSDYQAYLNINKSTGQARPVLWKND